MLLKRLSVVNMTLLKKVSVLLGLVLSFSTLVYIYEETFLEETEETQPNPIELLRNSVNHTKTGETEQPNTPLQNTEEPNEPDPPHRNFTQKLDITSWPLVRYPEMPYKEAKCLPEKFGFDQSHADKLFDPNRQFKGCEPTRSIASIQDNYLVIDCEGEESSYLFGPSPEKELIDKLNYKVEWTEYKSPVFMGEKEFAFAKCGDYKEPVYVHKALKSASERAEEIAKSKGKKKPLTVFLVMFDSVSRQHFFRNFPKTIEYLNSEFSETGQLAKDFAMYDFLVNNVHGENTEPNMVPTLYGYSDSRIVQLLKGFDVRKTKDWWKFRELQKGSLFQFFKDMGYVTMFGYDTVLNLFGKTGKEILTDHRAINFWQVAKKVFSYEDYTSKQVCLGPHDPHYYMLDYARQFMQNYEGYNRFGYVHLTTAHEPTGTLIRTADKDVKNFISEILNYYKHKEEDVVLMVASDHGKRLKELDKAIEGYLENQLPFHLLFANKELMERLGGIEADSNLKHNTKRLVSRLDWHMTFKHLALSPYEEVTTNSSTYKDWKSLTDSENARSLFLEKVNNERTCSDVGIQNYYCTCINFVETPLGEAENHPGITKLVGLGIGFLNNQIAKQNSEDICQRVSFRKLVAAETQYLEHYPVGKHFNFRARVGINENHDAVFELYGMMVKKNQGGSLLKKDSDGKLLPTAETDFKSLSNEKYTVQLHKVLRVDSFKGICEEMGRTLGIDRSTCICKSPETFDLIQNSVQKRLSSQMLSKLKIVLGEENEQCKQVCASNLKSCADWGFPILNTKKVLQRNWGTNLNVTMQGKEVPLKSLEIVDEQISSNGPGLIKENNGYVMAWGKSNLDCDQTHKNLKPLCPCSV